MMPDRCCAIAVMAKAPRAGRVKTRLVPPLSPEQAMALSASFLADVTANIATAGRKSLIRGFVAFAPTGTEDLFEGIVAPGTGFVLADGSPDMPAGVTGFGRSLFHAARSLLAQGFGSVCLLNADSPNLPTIALTQAADALAASGDRVVLGRAEDGGYYLLGIKAPHVRLFQDVDWSTERVATQTCARAGDLGLEVIELPVWYDVDDAASLQMLLRQLAHVPPTEGNSLEPAAPFAAPATARCVAELGLTSCLVEGSAARAAEAGVDPGIPPGSS